MVVVAVTAGVVAAILVQRQLSSAQVRAGVQSSVLVATAAMPAGTVAEDPQLFSLRSQPAEFAPADALLATEDALGRRIAVDLAPGSYVTESSFAATAAGGGARLRRGERALTVDVRIAPVDAEPSTGSQVDLVASGVGGSTQSELLVSGAEILSVGEVGEGGIALTLRLAAGQVESVTQADVFAREVRALIVP
jgi:Flp pilus assembly protein CpaB